MIVGFTGTRAGMTPAQRANVHELLWRFEVEQAHHGDCVGADFDFHDECVNWGVWTVLHPPEDPKQRAFCHGDVVLPAKPYIARNRDIVNACQLLLVAPKEDVEPRPGRGQGTWSTARYARKRAVPIRIFWPNGDTTMSVPHTS